MLYFICLGKTNLLTFYLLSGFPRYLTVWMSGYPHLNLTEYRNGCHSLSLCIGGFALLDFYTIFPPKSLASNIRARDHIQPFDTHCEAPRGPANGSLCFFYLGAHSCQWKKMILSNNFIVCFISFTLPYHFSVFPFVSFIMDVAERKYPPQIGTLTTSLYFCYVYVHFICVCNFSGYLYVIFSFCQWIIPRSKDQWSMSSQSLCSIATIDPPLTCCIGVFARGADKMLDR